VNPTADILLLLVNRIPKLVIANEDVVAWVSTLFIPTRFSICFLMYGYDNLCLLYHVMYFINYKSYCFCSRLFYPILLLCRFIVNVLCRHIFAIFVSIMILSTCIKKHVSFLAICYGLFKVLLVILSQNSLLSEAQILGFAEYIYVNVKPLLSR
jgi:hypothetical protein